MAGQSGQCDGHHSPGRGCGLADDHARRDTGSGGPGADRDLPADSAVGAARRHARRSLGSTSGPAPGPVLDGIDLGRLGLVERPRSGHAGHAPAVHLSDRHRDGSDRPGLAGERARDRAAGRACRRSHAQRHRHELCPRGGPGRRRRGGRRCRGGRRVLPQRRLHAGVGRRAPLVAARRAERRSSPRAGRQRHRDRVTLRCRGEWSARDPRAGHGVRARRVGRPRPLAARRP